MAEGKTKDHWENLTPKAKLVGSFSKHAKDHKKEREHLDKFVSEMKINHLKVKEDLQYDIDNNFKPKFRVRAPSEPAALLAVRYTEKRLKPPVSFGFISFVFNCFF